MATKLKIPIPIAALNHIWVRLKARHITAVDLQELKRWIDSNPDVSIGRWYKKFPGKHPTGCKGCDTQNIRFDWTFAITGDGNTPTTIKVPIDPETNTLMLLRGDNLDDNPKTETLIFYWIDWLLENKD